MRVERVTPHVDRDAWEIVIVDEFDHRHHVTVTGLEYVSDDACRRPAEIAMDRVLEERNGKAPVGADQRKAG